MKAPGSAVLALLAVGAAAVTAALVARPDGVRPPVLLLTIDTLRADRLGCYGCAAARTPNLDRLAAEGALFEDVSSSSPLTLPSHATILTGLHPPRHGLRDNATPHPLAPAESRGFKTAAETYKEAGYATAAFLSGGPLGKRWGLGAGFDEYDAPDEGEPGELGLDERIAAATVDRALDWLRAREKRRPFFLWVHLFDPHAPYRAPGGSGAPPDSSTAYDEEVAYADAHAGRLLDALRAEGILDRTVVAVCADHGEGLGDHGEQTHGYFLHRSTLRVPLLVRYPTRVAAGTRVTAPAGLVDVFPTLLDLSRRGPPDRPLDGSPLLSKIKAPDGGGSAGSRQYAETLHGWRAHRWAQSVALREGGLRVIDHGGERREAYDLAADPAETTDLVRTQAPRPEAARAAETAWSLFTSRPYLHEGGPKVDPGLGGVGYMTAFSPVQIQGARENGRLPLPSPTFVRRFDSVVRNLDRARGIEDSVETEAAVAEALVLLEELEKDAPANPALAFWAGRAFRQRAKYGSAGNRAWLEAFLKFAEAGRRGYREARTVSLMLEAAFHAKEYADMLRAAREAVETVKMDGDASFWGWVAMAWIHGGVDSTGSMTTLSRAGARAALEKAKSRSRSEVEAKKVGEIEGLIR